MPPRTRRPREAADRLSRVEACGEVRPIPAERIEQPRVGGGRVLELVGHDVPEARPHLIGDVGALGDQPRCLDHQVARVQAPRVAQDAVVAGVELGELDLAPRALTLRRAARLAIARRGPVAQALRAHALQLQQVDPAQEPRQEPRGVAADLVPAQGQVLDSGEHDREPIGRGDRGEERIEPGLDRMVAKEPLGDLLVGTDPELLVGSVERGVDPSGEGGAAFARASRQQDDPLGPAVLDEGGEPADAAPRTGRCRRRPVTSSEPVAVPRSRRWPSARIAPSTARLASAATLAAAAACQCVNALEPRLARCDAGRRPPRSSALFEDEPTIAGRTVYEGVGEGGDHALALDRRCEDIVFAELERLHRPRGATSSLSPRSGARWRSATPRRPWRVVIDPIDGSLNTRRTIPAHCLSVAVASGPRWRTWSGASCTSSARARSSSPAAARAPAERP